MRRYEALVSYFTPKILLGATSEYNFQLSLQMNATVRLLIWDWSTLKHAAAAFRRIKKIGGPWLHGTYFPRGVQVLRKRSCRPSYSVNTYPRKQSSRNEAA